MIPPVSVGRRRHVALSLRLGLRRDGTKQDQRKRRKRRPKQFGREYYGSLDGGPSQKVDVFKAEWVAVPKEVIQCLPGVALAEYNEKWVKKCCCPCKRSAKCAMLDPVGSKNEIARCAPTRFAIGVGETV